MIANVTYGYTSASFSGRMPMAELADSIVQVSEAMGPFHADSAPLLCLSFGYVYLVLYNREDTTMYIDPSVAELIC